MASTSSPHTWKYDVFPSFRGEDVRKSFLSHLLEKLQRKSIITFIDNNIERSCPIAPELVSAISESKISVVVFSKKYASSTWCLNELAEIHKCFKKMNQMVIPIFYGDVDPSHVRKQTGEFGKVFEETCQGKTEDEKQLWKKALAEVADIAGYDSRNWSDEPKMIEQISNDVSNKLFTPSDDFRNFVGIGAHVETIMDSKLCLEYEDVRMVGIMGHSGFVKTTIANAINNRLSSHFQRRAFVTSKRAAMQEDEYSMKLGWAKQLLSEILGQKELEIESLGMVEQRLKHWKVLIVLDDVHEIKLLEALVGKTEWFGIGSRIIVVTQDKELLVKHEIDLIYEVEFPSEDLALQMFCQSAFRKTSPPDGFMKLAAEVVKLAGNLPLGLNVLGSSLRKKDKEYWVEIMPRLQNGLNGEIEKTLRICYDGLSEKVDQDIFVYIACLFNGESVNYIKNLLPDSVYPSVSISLTTLVDKSLIRIIGPHHTVQMHILLRKLGREIVRAESIYNPGERRFLFDAEDICDVLTDNTGGGTVLGIYLNILEISRPLSIGEKSFQRMHNLLFLKVYKEMTLKMTGEERVDLPEGLVYLPRKLRLLYWDDYPLKYIPSNFNAAHLIELTMMGSKLEKLWEGTQPLRSLKTLNIAASRNLKEIPDLSEAINLVSLSLWKCTSLVTLPSSSIRNLNKLTNLLMSGCSNLDNLPTDVNLESLYYLDLMDCSRLRSFPRISRNISGLELDGTAMTDEEDCLWIENLSGLTELHWSNCPLRCMPSNFHPEHLVQLYMRDSKLEKLLTGVQSLERLEFVDFSGSKNLKEIPNLSARLEYLGLDDCKSLEMLPSSFQILDKLGWSMSGCESLKEIPDLSKATNLIELDLSGCESMKEIPDLPKASKLKELILNNCKSLKKLPDSIRNLEELTNLDMNGCTSLEVLPTIFNLEHLDALNLCGCSQLTSFPRITTSIQYLDLSGTAIEEVPPWIENIIDLTHLWMIRCEKLKTISANIWNLENLKSVDFTDCGGVTSVSGASLFMKTVAELHEERYFFCPDSEDTKFIFYNCFNLDREAHELILQAYSRFSVLPVKEVPTYFTHRTSESYLGVRLDRLPQSSLPPNCLRIKACIIPGPATDFQYTYPEIIVHWRFRNVTGAHKFKLDVDSAKLDQLVVFHFHIWLQEDSPSQSDCNRVDFKVELHKTNSCLCYDIYGYGTKGRNLNTCPDLPHKGFGIRVLNVFPSQDGNDKSSETEYTDQSGESDVENGRSKKRMRMTVETSEENHNSLCGQTEVKLGSTAPSLELSLGMVGASTQVASRSKVPSPSISSRNFHGNEASLNLSLPLFDPRLEGESLYSDPMVTEQQDTWTSSKDPLLSPQLTNYLT